MFQFVKMEDSSREKMGRAIRLKRSYICYSSEITNVFLNKRNHSNVDLSGIEFIDFDDL